MKISIHPDQAGYRLYVESLAGSSPAGPRLFKGNPPMVKFVHSTLEEATKAMVLLQKHVDEKQKTK